MGQKSLGLGWWEGVLNLVQRHQEAGVEQPSPRTGTPDMGIWPCPRHHPTNVPNSTPQLQTLSPHIPNTPAKWGFSLVLQAHQPLSDFCVVSFLGMASPSFHIRCLRSSPGVTSSVKAFLITSGRIKVSCQDHSYICSPAVQIKGLHQPCPIHGHIFC